MAWIAGLIALAAAATSAYNTNQAVKKQDRVLAEGIRQQAKVQKRGNERLNETLGDLERSRPGGEQAGALEQYHRALQGTEQQAKAGQAIQGLSEAYDSATSAGTKNAQGRVGNIADLLSRLDAPGLQRQREGFGVADLGSNLGALGREAQGIDYLARMKAQNVRRNPYLDVLAAGLNSYAGGYGGGGSSAGAGVSGTPQTTSTGVNYAGYA